LSPLISIILPVYNVEKYLNKCTQSIINQTYKNFEIICIDDGSTDKSGEILDELARQEPRMRVIHQENRGLMSVRTRGISETKGEYIAFVDGDDYITADMFQTLAEAIEKNSSDIAVCGFEFTDEDGVRLNAVTPQDKTITADEAIKELLYKDIYKTGLTPLWNKLYKKELFAEFAPSKKIKNLGEDIYINLFLIGKADKVTFSSKICYSYIQREGSFAKVPKPSHIDDFFGLWSEKKEFIDRLGLLDSNREEIFEAYFSSVFDFYGFCYKADKEGLIPLFNERLKLDVYFKASNLPLTMNSIARAVKFLARRYL